MHSYYLDLNTNNIKLFNDNFNLSNPRNSIEYIKEVFDDKIMENVIEKDGKLFTVRSKLKS